MTLTKSTHDHPFNTIYERLRKRSYRRHLRSNLGINNDAVYLRWEHEAYVQGVKDALEAAAAQR